MRKFSLLWLVSFSFCVETGYIDSMLIVPEASNLYRDDLYVVCPKEIPRSQEQEETSFSIEYVPLRDYKGGCDVQGEVSQFYLFHLIPISGSLDPEYALGTMVQKYEGDTIINIRAWHESHYYNVLGQVRLLKLKGTVIKFQIPR
ncbi:MAG: hypothetical protein NZ853_08390 [Leptospiraceae bacterium]|nr:hypothetical protein [Leptospiraceae bacterium]MDW7976807.1 hypothetical protein [Leptospiraceae bacterium]